jgi:ornithine cyclodeaminase/alanine dehydrogenase-like protein (mu-crystallin family)
MQDDRPAPGELLFLSREDVTAAVDPEDCLERVEDTFRWVGEDRVEQTNPIEIWLAKRGDEFGFGNVSSYPAYVEPLGVAGNKWLGVFQQNARRGLPTLSAVNVLSDATTAMPLALLEGQSVTAIRTAGHAGVGAKHLARPDSSTLAIVGCGHEGRTHLRVMDALFDLDRINACDIDDAVRETFVAEMGDQTDAEVVGYTDAEAAVEGADVVCMVTTAESPIVMAEWIEPGTHVAATNGFQDLDPTFSAVADRWVIGVESRDRLWIDGEEVGVTSPEGLEYADVDAELTDVVAGDAPGRQSDDERTVMVHMGMPALDVAASHFVYEKAKRAGVGTQLTLFE